MKRLLLSLLLFPSSVYAGDAPLFWRFGEISNRLLIYTGEDVIRTGIPTSIFLVGLFTGSAGLIWLVSFWKSSSPWHRFIGVALVLGTIGAYALSWLFGYIGETRFSSFSVRLFWSWACTGAMIGSMISVSISFTITNPLKPRQNKTLHPTAGNVPV